MGTVIVYILGCLCLCLLWILIKFLHKVWWTPFQIESAMRSQGIKGPSYKFLHGNTEEIIEMRRVATSDPMELSHHMLSRIQPHIYSWIKLYGNNFLYWYVTRGQLVITEPELVKEVLNSKEDVFCKIPFQEFIKKLAGDGLIVSTGKKSSKMRKLANHAFHGENLKNMFPEMTASVKMMLERWRQHEGKVIDVFEEFKVLASEIISRTAFGSCYQEGEKIFDMLMKIVIIIGRTHFTVRIPGIQKLLKSQDDIEMEKLHQQLKDSIKKIIKKREEEAMSSEGDGYGSDFLGVLLDAYHNSDKTMKISLDDLIDECKNFYVAGQETTANSLTWTVFLLAIHTDWQDRERKEVLEIFGQQTPTADGIARLKTIGMIINESLRLYPPIVNITRQAQREVKLGGLTIPEKMEVYIPKLALHHNPEIWGKDAHLFKPERFAEGLAKATNNNVPAFLPFGLGPRMCVGLNFAQAEKKIALSMILQKYRFALSPSYAHSPVQIVTLSPQRGVQILLETL